MKTQIFNQAKAVLLSTILVASSVMALPATAGDQGLDVFGESQQKHKKNKHHQKREFRKMVKVLDLSDEQKAQIKAIRAQAKEDKKASKETMRAFKQSVKPLAHSDELDEQAVLDLFETNKDFFAQQLLAEVKTKHAIYQVLTPEQRIKWQAYKEARKLNRK